MGERAYDIVVIGAGHAGCEAALASARMGLRTLLLTLNLDGVALMACNPSIGGTAKGHLVREVDALGGEMGRAIDDTYLQSRLLNTGKGPAVQSLRAQADKKAYQARMLQALWRQEKLTVKQGEASGFLLENGRIEGVRTATGGVYRCRAAVVCAGVFAQSRVITGEYSAPHGPSGLARSEHLSGALRDLGFELRRFKTGTPARIDIRTVDLGKFEKQPGDERTLPFSFLSGPLRREQIPCYLGYTTEKTHQIVRQNLHRAPLFRGDIQGTGARYCPSIEDKVVRFAERERHPVFLEPEGAETVEWYVQGLSSSMPEDVQEAMYRSIPGMERVELVRLAYAIEYDVIDARTLTLPFMAKAVPGLFFAGQINGTSGYEEAAAQGIFAGMNAALWAQGKAPLLIGRDEGYIGVLADDLTLKGADEPYRMMTSRAEYRLLLRQGNADFRLTERSYRCGLATEERLRTMLRRREAVGEALSALEGPAPQGAAARLLEAAGQPPTAAPCPWKALLSRPGVSMGALLGTGLLPDLGRDVWEEAAVLSQYAGYIQRQERAVREQRQAEEAPIPEDLDYASVRGIRTEARQKLQSLRPRTIGQAGRISGVNPADIAVLLLHLAAREKGREGGGRA